MPSFSNAGCMLLMSATLCGLAGCLSGCSEYLDHRETVSLQGGNAVLANKVVQTIDPWPRESADNNIAYNGTVVEGAIERYRARRVKSPGGNASGGYQNASNTNTPLGPQVNQSTAASK
jgi:hypothetical protein